MGSCGDSITEDDPSGGSFIEEHSCSELPVQQSCPEEACDAFDSTVAISDMNNSFMDSPFREGHAGSASIGDVTEVYGDALVSKCENDDMLILEKTVEDDCQNHLITCCNKIEVSDLKSGGLSSGEKFQADGSRDMPSEFITGNGMEKHRVHQGEQKEDESNIFLPAGDATTDVEVKNGNTGLLTDDHNCMFDFRHSEISSESEPATSLLIGCNQQNEQEDIMSNADPLSNVLEKCNHLGGMEADACQQISPSQSREVSSGVLYPENGPTGDQINDQKGGSEDWNSSFVNAEGFVDKERIIDTCVEVLSPPGCPRTLGSLPMVDSPCDPTLSDMSNGINDEAKSDILQIEDKFFELKGFSSEATTNPESGQPPIVLFTYSSSEDVPNLLPKVDDGSLDNNIIAKNLGQTENEGKDVVEADFITESILLSSQRNSRRTKVGRKKQTKKASRKRRDKASVSHPDGGLKIILEPRKKRSCFSKPARSSTWGLLGNIRQAFEQDNELGVSEAMCQGLGKPRSSRQSGKVTKEGANSSPLSSVQKFSVSTTRVRLKIKLGKEVDLGCLNFLTSKAVDGLASASYVGSDSGSQKVPINAEGKFSEVMTLGTNDLYKDAVLENGLDENSHTESPTITEKLVGDAEELCPVVPSERGVEALVDPMNNRGMDPGTSPDSEVINSVLERQVGERHHEDVHHAALGSSKGFNSHLDVAVGKRGKKKDKLTRSAKCVTEDVSQGPPRNNRAKHSKNRRCKKNNSDAFSSLELLTSVEINASKSISCKELSTEPMPLSGESELGDSVMALNVKNQMEVKTTCNPSVDNVSSASCGSENLLSSANSFGCKLPKSLKPCKVRETKSKVSDSTSRKKSTCRRREKQRKPINKSEIKGKIISQKVTCEVEDCQHTVGNDVVGNHKLDAVGKINAGEERASVNVSDSDMLPGVGFGEQHHSPHDAWVLCDDCHKWRRILAVLADKIEETNCTWTCKDSCDKAFSDCTIPQEKSNAEINAELGLSDASGEEDVHEDPKNYRELEHRQPWISQESTFTRILTNEFLHRSRKSQTIDEIMVCHCKPSQESKSGCGDECLNRMLNIECVQGTCPCGDQCSNQQFQQRKYASLKWFQCGKKGYGLKALEDISKGQFLIEYVGEVLDMHAYEARQREYALKGHRHFYFMTLNGSEVIDASAKGNLGRFINHSCDPNCRTEKWMVNGEICIGLFALREIKQDEEVTFDYNYVRVFGAAAKKCYCGSPSCRGYIGGGDPLNDEVIVQGDSDEEFPEPVMLTEDGEIEDSVPVHKFSDHVGAESASHMIKDGDGLGRATTDIGADGTPEKDNSMDSASAISPLHSSSEVEDSKGKLPSSVPVEEISQQMEDVTSIPMPDAQQGYPMESELVDNTYSIQRLETTSSITTVSKVLSDSIHSTSKFSPEMVEGMPDIPESNPFTKSPRPNGSIKKGKLRANPPSGLKTEVTANRLQVSSIKLKKVAEGSSNGRFEAVQEKLNELLDGDGGISKRKDATKGYLKLLLLTVASGDRSNGEAIQSNRDLSMILDALLKTKSKAVLNDIINKNGLQMLHKIMKQYRQDFKKIPILRKLLKVLEYLAASKILTLEHINGSPPCRGMESFRESMLSLTEHDDKQVHQIARSFRDRWIPRHARKHGCMDRDDNRVDSHRSFNSNRFSTSHNHRHEKDSRPTEAIDCVQQSVLVDAVPQEGCTTPPLYGGEIKGTKKRKRKSRWDQPADPNIYTCAVSSINERQNVSEDVPPGFSCPLGALNASLHSGGLPSQNVSHSRCPSDAVIGHPKEKFNSRLPVSYGMPWSVVQQYGTPRAETPEIWVTAPGMPFNPFPPLPSYPRDEKVSQASNTTNSMTIDQPTEVGHVNRSDLVHCYSDDTIPCTTGANLEDTNLSSDDNRHTPKKLKSDTYDLGTRYFKQQKWNNQKIHRPWFRRNAWKCSENESRGDICSIGVGNVPNESEVTCSSDRFKQ